jgi:hypothetical protein
LCRILRRIDDNDYRLELSNKFDISPTFNIVHLYEFHEGDKGEDEGAFYAWEQQLTIKKFEEVEEISATRIGRKMHNKEYMEYLVKWKNRGFEDAFWVLEEEIVNLRRPSSFQVVPT